MTTRACRTTVRRGIGLFALALATATGGEPPRLAESEFSGFRDRWMELFDASKVPGFSVVVVRGDQVILLDGFGVRNVDTAAPVTPDTMFYIASCTKPFNAVTAVALAEDGRLNLDAAVKKYLPQLKLADASLTDAITVRDLMCHRHGINQSEIVFNDAYSGLITDELYFRLLAEAQVQQAVTYTNVHYTLLGRVIQAVSSKDWRDALSERVLVPAGMTRTTGYADRMYADDNAALPHICDGGKWMVSALRKTDRTMHAAGGLGSSARDLGRWLRLHVNDGMVDGKRVISSAGLQDVLKEQSRMPRPRGTIRKEEAFGLGWMKGTFRGKGPYYSHGGGYIGASAYMAFMPNEKIGIALLLNAGDVANALGSAVAVDVFDKLLGTKSEEDLVASYLPQVKQYLQRPSQRPTSVNPAEKGGLSLAAQAYAGSYENPVNGRLQIEFDGKRLAGRLGDLNLDLFSTATDRFTAWVVPDLTFNGAFEVKGDRVIALVLTEPDGNGATRRFERLGS